VIARYYFYSVTDAVAPLSNLTKGSKHGDAIDKVAVAHLCVFDKAFLFIRKGSGYRSGESDGVGIEC